MLRVRFSQNISADTQRGIDWKKKAQRWAEANFTNYVLNVYWDLKKVRSEIEIEILLLWRSVKEGE